MNVREKKTHKYLEQLGFMVHTVSKPAHFGMSHDIFNLWDHIAVVPKGIESPIPFAIRLPHVIIEHNMTNHDTWFNVPEGHTIYIQTKSRKQYGKDLDKYRDFPSTKFLFVWTKDKSNKWNEPYIKLL